MEQRFALLTMPPNKNGNGWSGEIWENLYALAWMHTGVSIHVYLMLLLLLFFSPDDLAVSKCGEKYV